MAKFSLIFTDNKDVNTLVTIGTVRIFSASTAAYHRHRLHLYGVYLCLMKYKCNLLMIVISYKLIYNCYLLSNKNITNSILIFDALLFLSKK